jgi:hypothetical protein
MRINHRANGTNGTNALPLAALFAGVVASAPARAQTPDSTQFRCDGKVISAIYIQPHPPAVTERGPNVMRQALQRFVFQSGTTRDRAIRPFLLARVGDRCSDKWLPELARVVRAQPYLAVATVRAESDGGDGVRLVVETVDEVPVIIGGGYTKNGLTNVKYGNSNIGGSGFYAASQWRDGRAYRDALAMTLRQYGMFGQPIVGEVSAQRDVLGGQFNASVSRPFLSDLEHIAWYAGGTHENTYRAFVRASGPELSLPVSRDIWSVGSVARFGWRGASLLFGPVATYENSRPGDAGVIASDSGLVPADTSVLANRYTPYKTFRAGLGAGFRWLDYMRVTGFDALLGEQDVARGFQLAATFERGLSAFSATDQSSLLSVDMYSGIGTPRSFVGLAMRGEELPAGAGDSWSGAALSGRLAWYVKPSDTRTFEASAEFAGGWRERLPLQLSLGDAVSGVRGYNGAAIAGGRRAVLRLEERSVSYQTKFVQWGTAFFTDVGKTWSGDVPFGQTTVARASVGVGLLAAVPPKSRRMLRADLAVPVTGGAPKGWVLRVFATDMTRFFWRDPSDLSPVRAGAPASSIFGWP